jgi:beta-xylosidase
VLTCAMEALTREAPKPVYENYFADPYVWRHGDEFFAIGTGEREASGDPSELVFPVLRSNDFEHWEFASRAMLRPQHNLGTNFWAPEVVFSEGKFYLYYSVGFADAKHQLRVATSPTPLGPFQDLGVALIDPSCCSFAIDAHAFRDDDGSWYLFYARDFLDTDNDARPGTALSVVRMKTMTELAGEHRTVLRATRDWQRFQADRPIYGGSFDWHTLEGPFVVKRRGRYFCFYSAGRWENDTYGVDFAVADHPLGPWKSEGNESGARVLRTIPGELIGPGHNSIMTTADGQDWIVYHAWDAKMTGRRMFIDPLVWTDDGPRCARML